MAKKQLDLNAPLISVRRFSSPQRTTEGINKNPIGKSPPNRQTSLPATKTDYELSDVTKPAAVPFHWEKIPGRAKEEREGPLYPPDGLSTTPKLPPGRVSGVIRYNSGESPKLLSGRVSGFSRHNSGERANDPNIKVEAFPLNDHASLIQKLHESLNSRDDSDAESGEEAYSDALDKLSFTESRSLECSLSGLSGYHGSGRKPSGTFSVDVQTKDFMMSRFLPAAKAVVLETPKHVVKKQQPAVIEQPKTDKKVVSCKQKPLPEQYGSNIVSHYIQYAGKVESEEDDNLEHRVPVKKAGKIWGILPRFCVKNSLCLLNPLPGMKPKHHTPASPAREVRKLKRNAHSGPLEKNVYHAIHKKKYHSGVLSRDMLEIGNKIRSDSNQFSYTGDSCRRQCRSGPISPYRNEAPKSPFREGIGFLGVPKDIENHAVNKIPGPGSPGLVVEKTLYVDAPKNCPKDEKTVKSSGQNLSSRNVSPKLRKSRPVSPYQNEASKYYFNGRNANKIDSSRKLCKALQDVSRNHANRKVSSSPGDAVEKTLYIDAMIKTDISKADKVSDSSDKNLKPSEFEDKDSLKSSHLNTKENVEQDDERDADFAALKSPLPPPLPKSPSESWLWRTLPSISLPNPFSHSNHFHPNKPPQKVTANGDTWETIVKTTNSRHDHVHRSKELMSHVTHLHNKA